MIENRPHVVFISNSGSEVMSLINMGVINPSRIILHSNPRLKLNTDLQNFINKSPAVQYVLPEKPTIYDYTLALSPFLNPIITLHGFLRVIPPEICDKYEIYNLHPGLITEYPELKGLDPQKRVIEQSSKYPFIGCVIHKVISEVDAGEILIVEKIENPIYANEVFIGLKGAALLAWSRFFSNFGCTDNIETNNTLQNCKKSNNLDIIKLIETKYPQTCNEFKRLQNEDYLLFCQKQNDYGPGNISVGSSLETEEERKVSQSSIIFRCFDKVQRLINLVVKNPQTIPANEPIADAYADLTNYGIIARIVRNQKWGK